MKDALTVSCVTFLAEEGAKVNELSNKIRTFSQSLDNI